MSDVSPSVESDALVLALVAERKRLGWSQREVARRSGIATGAMCDIERGAHSPVLRNLRSWAESLGFEVVLARGKRCAYGEFTEDVNGFSMCMCGVPALTHEQVYLTSVLPPAETTGAES